MAGESPTPLEELVDSRRRELLINKTEMAARTGVHPSHLRKVLTGKATLTPDVSAALDHALQWPHGELDRRLGALSRERASPPADEAQRQDLIREMRELRDRHLEEAAKAAAALARLEGGDTEAAS